MMMKSKNLCLLIFALMFMMSVDSKNVVAAEKQLPRAIKGMEQVMRNNAEIIETGGRDVMEVSSHPVLLWKGYPDAVMYEFELSRSVNIASDSIVWHTVAVYTPGFQPDLSKWRGQTVYYRFRPLDYERNPIAKWSNTVAIKITHRENFREFHPYTTSNWSKVTPILYPVYSWIPVFGAAKYRVEVYSVKSGGSTKSKSGYQLIRTYEIGNGLAFDCYDECPRVGTYAWRVQALDKDGLPIGQFSDMEIFSLNAVPHQFKIGVFGDSIMHGGGAISGPPSDFCYSLHAYLKMPAVNLAKSGDTAAASLQRFDKDVAPFSPQALIVMTGTNSIRGGEKAETVIKDLTAIYRKCKKNNIAPFFLTLPPVNPERIFKVFQEGTALQWQGEFQKVNRFILDNLPYVDVAPLFTDTDGTMPVKWSTDGLHPDSKAKKAMADMINRSLTAF